MSKVISGNDHNLLLMILVISTLTEPFPGWIDNLNGPVGLLVGYGTGAVRTCILDSNIMPDFIPVDVAIRGLILSAYTRVYKKYVYTL